MALPVRPPLPEVLNPSPIRPHAAPVIPLPQRAQSPTLLRQCYRVTQGLVSLLSGATLLTYAATVWAEWSWQKQYDYLLRLRQQRWELMSVTATLHHHLVQSGVSGSGTVIQTPAQSLFVTPAPRRSPRPVVVPPADSWSLGGY
jgi:hypothetical protein